MKGGYIADWFNWGDTAFSFDYWKGNDIVSDNNDPKTWAAAVVQHVRDYGAELYLAVRRYTPDDPTVNGERRETKDNTSVLIGTRVKF